MPIDLVSYMNWPVELRRDFDFLCNEFDGKELVVGDLDAVLTRSTQFDTRAFLDDPTLLARVEKYAKRGAVFTSPTGKPYSLDDLRAAAAKAVASSAAK